MSMKVSKILTFLMSLLPLLVELFKKDENEVCNKE